MSVFDSYAGYYDLINQSKNYKAETDYLDALIRAEGKQGRQLLDIGCGTGLYDFLLAQKGYRITGLDFSPGMIKIANQKKNSEYASRAEMLDFQVGDATQFRLGQKFDVVLALFHVLSYMNQNQDVMSMLKRIKEHLSPDGIFVGDFWYGPGVLLDPPSVRVKNMKSQSLEVVRTAEPEMHLDHNLVDVNYSFMVFENGNKECQRFREQHRMRYFFKPELELLASNCGLKVHKFMNWMEQDWSNPSAWTACVVLKHE